MIHKTGDLFNTELEAIGHGVNTVGKMGAGIAVQFRDRFVHNLAQYQEACATGLLRPGLSLAVLDYDRANNRKRYYVFNMASQRLTGRDATYNWLDGAARTAAIQARARGLKSIAIPEIGCGIGGLEWPIAQKILEVVEIITPEFEWEVWHYDG